MGGRRQALAAPLRHRPADRGDGREQGGPVDDRGTSSGFRSACTRTSAAGSASFDATARCPSRWCRRTSSFSQCGRGARTPLPRARPGRPLRLSAGHWRASSSSTAATGETFTEDIGEENPVAVYIPGHNAHGFEALTDILFCYHVTVEYDPAHPDEQTLSWNDPRVAHLWSSSTRSSPRGTPPSNPDHGRRRPARPRARAGVRGRGRGRGDPCRLGRDRSCALRSRGPGARPRPAHGSLDRRGRCGSRPTGRGRGERGGDGERRGPGRTARDLLDRLRLRRREGRAVRRVRSGPPRVRVRPHEAPR